MAVRNENAPCSAANGQGGSSYDLRLQSSTAQLLASAREELVELYDVLSGLAHDRRSAALSVAAADLVPSIEELSHWLGSTST